jgi:hypothetical protein
LANHFRSFLPQHVCDDNSSKNSAVNFAYDNARLAGILERIHSPAQSI